MHDYVKRLVTNLLDTLDLRVAVENSFLHHHAIGFQYLNLLRTPSLTVKVYIAETGRFLGCGTAGYLVHPHNHAYDFDTFVLRGHVTNVLFREDDSRMAATMPVSFANPVDKYIYEPRPSAVAKQTCDSFSLTPTERHTYGRGDHYAMNREQVHTIKLDPNETSVAILMQYASKAKWTALYTPPDVVPRFDGLYMRPTGDDIVRMKTLTYEALNAS